MDLSKKEHGKTIISMGLERKDGMMGLSTKGCTRMVPKVVSESIYGQMVVNTKEILSSICFKGMECIYGPMEEMYNNLF